MILSNTSVEPRGTSTQLIVLVHAWTMKSLDLKDIVECVKEQLPDADLLVPDYPSGLLCNVDPLEIATGLVAIISDAVDKRKNFGTKYDEIIFVGHSLGSLLLRKAYCFASGQTQDEPRAAKTKAKEWTKDISRIILLAGMNRGWTLVKKPRHLPWSKLMLMRFLSCIFRWTRRAQLINSVRRGSPFIANLRIQWLNLIRSGARVPPTMQLLGTLDDIVSEEDNVDLLSGNEFFYRDVQDTGHKDVIDFSGPVGERRRSIFVWALKSPVDKLTSDKQPPLDPDESVERVVFVMHGIRDRPGWTQECEKKINELAALRGVSVDVQTASYGYFPMGGFLIQPERQKNVRWFADQYTEKIAKFPSAKVSFVGHSNGTYLLASALRRYPPMNFDQIVFAGSVVPKSFPWDEMKNNKRFTRFRNYLASRDFVVAIFPAFFELFPGTDIGSGGHNPFLDDAGHQYQIQYAKGSHGAAIVSENFEAIGKFVLGDDESEIVHNPVVLSKSQSTCAIIANKFCWAIWFLLIAITVAASFGSIFLEMYGHWDPMWPIAWWVPPIVVPPTIYAILRFI